MFFITLVGAVAIVSTIKMLGLDKASTIPEIVAFAAIFLAGVYGVGALISRTPPPTHLV